MKSLVSLVNVTGSTITRFGTDFPTGTPVVVYRNRTFLVLGEDFGRLVSDLANGDLVGYDFDGVPNSPEESVEVFNTLANELLDTGNRGSYSPEYHWKKASSLDLLDGLRRQIVEFDFGSATVTELETLDKLVPVVTYLNAGFLDLAVKIVDGTPPDGPDDFLSPTRVGIYRALFVSANV